MNSELKPKIRFKGFTDDWEQRKLGDIIVDTVDNRGKNPSYYCETGIPVIDNFMIKNNGYPELYTATRFLDDYLFNNFVRKYNEYDDVLITLVGNGIGNIALFPKQKSAIIQNTLGMRFEEPKKFKYYELLSKNNEIVKLDRGMAQPSIRQDELKSINVKLPKIGEQLKIEKMMFNIDNLITLHQRRCDKLVELKNSLLEKMFPQNISVIPEIRFRGFTGDWEQCKLGNLGYFRSNGVDKKINENEIEVNLLNYMDVYNSRKINNKNAKLLMKVSAKKNQIIECNIEKNDIFFTPTSETSDDIGRVLVIEESLNNTVYSYHLMRYRPKPGEFYSTFPNYGFTTKELREQMRVAAKGVQRYVISKTDFEQLEIKRPTLEEQKKIALFMTCLDNLIHLHQRKHDKLNKIKQSLLNDMFV